MMDIRALDAGPQLSVVDTSEGYRLTSQMQLHAPAHDVFDFFSRAENLEALTPSWLRFQICTPTPISMYVGARIDYRLRIHGVPVVWQSEITTWEPGRRFVDEQRVGPYRRWIHEHLFVADGDDTVVRDRVDYDVYGGRIIERLLVRPDLRRIFGYRLQTLQTMFNTVASATPCTGKKTACRFRQVDRDVHG